MRKFKFFGDRIRLRDAVEAMVYDLCAQYTLYRDMCERTHMQNNPEDDSFPIPHVPIEHYFPEGKLWHSGTDYDEETAKLIHFLFMDMYRENEDLFIMVEETDDRDYIIYDITHDNSRYD